MLRLLAFPLWLDHTLQLLLPKLLLQSYVMKIDVPEKFLTKKIFWRRQDLPLKVVIKTGLLQPFSYIHIYIYTVIFPFQYWYYNENFSSFRDLQPESLDGQTQPTKPGTVICRILRFLFFKLICTF